MHRLTFTFDNGPVAGATEKVLDFLTERSLKATFFVVGKHLQTSWGQRLAKRAHAEGHWMGNHTLTHGEPLGSAGSVSNVDREIGETQRLLGPLAHRQKFFRPNGKGSLGPHLLSREAMAYLVDHQFTVVTWNNVPRDWEKPKSAWLDRACAGLAKLPWSLLVLHDEHIAGMMDTLIEFHRRAVEMKVEIVQGMPPDCMPIKNGKVGAAIDGLVALEASAATAASELPRASRS